MLGRMDSFSRRARAEGRIPEMGWIDKAAYVVKYLLRPELSSPAAAHFRRQTALIGRLARPTPPPLATLGFAGDVMWIRRNWGDFLAPDTLASLRASGEQPWVIGRIDACAADAERVVLNNLKGH